MTINEAIENLRILHSSPLLYETENYRDAVRLGIEALKEKRQTRFASHRTEYDLLPGETEEKYSAESPSGVKEK